MTTVLEQIFFVVATCSVIIVAAALCAAAVSLALAANEARKLMRTLHTSALDARRGAEILHRRARFAARFIRAFAARSWRSGDKQERG